MPPFTDSTDKTLWFSVNPGLRELSLREAAQYHETADPQRAEKVHEEAKTLFAKAQAAWKKAAPRAYVPVGLQKVPASQKLTQKDKLALLCELAQSPADFLAAGEALEEIAGMLQTKNTQFHGFLCDTLKELIISNKVVPLARPLRAFVQQPVFQLPHDAAARERTLVLWCFEDSLKTKFRGILTLMEEELRIKWTTSDGRKLNTLRFLSELLHRVPEQTNRIAATIVNKLGDPNAVVAARCSLILIEFMKKHSNEQLCVVQHLQRLIEDSATTEKTLRSVIHIFNQIVFGYRNQRLPAACISVYVDLFRKRLAAGEIEQRIMNGILTGMKRALPYAGTSTQIKKEIDAVFVMASASQLFHNRVSALSLLLFCLDREAGGFHERFYRSLYHLVPFDPTHMPQNAHLSLFFALMHKSLSKAHDPRVVAAFVHRLLQAALVNSAAYACATLMTLSDLYKCNPSVSVVLGPKRPAINAKYFADILSKDNSDKTPRKAQYDPLARDPQYAHAATEPAWELTQLMRHYHPTVVKFAERVAAGQPIDHAGNPLDDFSLLHFCELFMHKKPKKVRKSSASVHQRQPAPEGGDAVTEANAFVARYDTQKRRVRKRLVSEAARKNAVEAEQEDNAVENREEFEAEEERSTKTVETKKKVLKDKSAKKSKSLLAKYCRFGYDDMDGVLLASAGDDKGLEAADDGSLLEEEAKDILATKGKKRAAVEV